MLKYLLTAACLTAVYALPVAAQAKMMEVEMVKSQEVTLAGGKKVTVYVVKMDGHMMVALPDDALPDPLHQQLFTVQH